jgi:hypothetical protein
MRWANNPVATSWNWYTSQTAALIANYDRIGAHIGAEIVPIARICRELTADRPPDLSSLPPADQRDDWLYSGDNIHQGPYGKGMFAYAFAAVLSRQSPIGQKFAYGEYTGVPAAIDQAIQEGVWNVLGEREVWARGR